MSARSFSMITGSAIAALIVLSASVESQAQRCLDPRFRVELVAEVPEIEHPSVVPCDQEGNL